MKWSFWMCLVLVTNWTVAPLSAESKGVVSAQLVTYVAPVVPESTQGNPPAAAESFFATLGIDGKLHDLKSAKAEDEFTVAARDAAAQWVYTPYKRKDKPFEKAVYVAVNMAPHTHLESYTAPIKLGTAFMATLVEKAMNPVPSPMSGVSASLIVLGTIARDGSTKDAKVMSGPPMLSSAALSTVHTWVYRAYLLDGVPVEVETVMRVVFAP